MIIHPRHLAAMLIAGHQPDLGERDVPTAARLRAGTTVESAAHAKDWAVMRTHYPTGRNDDY
jgi:hypothetical protein